MPSGVGVSATVLSLDTVKHRSTNLNSDILRAQAWKLRAGECLHIQSYRRIDSMELV